MNLPSLKTIKKYVSTKRSQIIYGVLLSIVILFLLSYILKEKLIVAYYNQYSIEIQDRNGNAISRYPNEKGHYLKLQENIPERFKELLIKKEDRFFHYHFGINPISIGRAFLNYITKGAHGGSSTITQQLVKILLDNEQNRTLRNKLIELFYTESIELYLSKEEILNMYINSVYLGNQAQGFTEASHMYFNKPPEMLDDIEILSLLATVSSPSIQNPWKYRNEKITEILADRFDVENDKIYTPKNKVYYYQQPAFFELQSMNISCTKTCVTTIDQELTEKLREILKRHIYYSYDRGVKNGAIVVIKEPENELLAIVGSYDPRTSSGGSQINMAIQPRPIGSTIKPFIYLEGFRNGLRPYTIVEDREYKYGIATGFPLYPKNYDGKYRGKITLHEALSNSLNVPSVKVLEYIGLTNFYDFLEQKLTFSAIQDLDSYQFGIALGGLEMDLLTLTHFFSIFTNDGILSPLNILQYSDDGSVKEFFPPQSHIAETRKIAEPDYAQLVNKILSDRKTGVEQFGLVSNLNLTQNNYAVKTGTSIDFHDSWVVGYTPDFIVGVWLGNSENTPLQQISGQTGAGRAWQEVMELLFTTSYNKETQFLFDRVTEFQIENSLEYGLFDDSYENHRYVLEEKNLILSPHNDDIFELTLNTSIPLIAKQSVKWFVNGDYLGEGESAQFNPEDYGAYEIQALTESGEKEFMQIKILDNDY
jgi:membrane carboxypeptidase/penicillin-binding protein PbpC